MEKQILKSWRLIVEMQNRKWVLNENVRQEARKMAEWIYQWDSQWVALLSGNVGTGKTTLMNAVIEATTPRKIWHREFSADFSLSVLKDPEIILRVAEQPLVAMDDVGREATEVNFYGNSLTPMADFLEYRYREKKKTILTTNLSLKEFVEKYGERVKSRMKEMVFPVIFLGGDFRRICS